MLIKVLIDNNAKDDFKCEWGLAIYLEYNDKKVLLDTGSSSSFLYNANLLGIDLSSIDFGFLSHSHFDHSNGLDSFFEINKTAPVYVSSNSNEACYKKEGFLSYKYIGIKRGTLEKYSDRFIFVEGKAEIIPGIYILPHLKDYNSKNNENVMFQKHGFLNYKLDDFNHEQSIIFKTQKGLVVFNGCSHVGLDNIIDEINESFPSDNLYAYIGGLHLYNSNEKYVCKIVEKIKKSKISKIYTGHCTGENSLNILKEALPEVVFGFYSGMEENL